ncbi:hypothetical protein H9Q69_004987 [Fusarium xylarioides]|nr:hypothetical protein H9Q69_004987 [Fusarium xylarioides]
MTLDPATRFSIEAWTYLAISLIRWRWLGLRGLAADDYLMVVAALLFTAETATAYYVGAYWQGLANNSEEYYKRVRGSQTQLFGWLVYTVLLWSLKLCWLFFFRRLGNGVDYMALKIKIVWNARVSGGRKISLILIFCGGLITAVFGGLRCGYVLRGGVNGPQQAGEWSCRESFVAMIITNLPVMAPFIKRGLKNVYVEYVGYKRSQTDGTPQVGEGGKGVELTTIGGKRSNKNLFRHPLSLPAETYAEQHGSQERIIEGRGCEQR